MAWGDILFGSGGTAAVLALLSMNGGDAAPAAPITAPSEAVEQHSLRVQRASDGLFYLAAEVNGTAVRFLVDTGATVTMLTPRDARRAGVTAAGAAVRLRTASGHGRMRWARLDRMRFGSSEMRDLDAAVVSSGLPVSLLGQNALTRMGRVIIVGNELHLR